MRKDIGIVNLVAVRLFLMATEFVRLGKAGLSNAEEDMGI